MPQTDSGQRLFAYRVDGSVDRIASHVAERLHVATVRAINLHLDMVEPAHVDTDAEDDDLGVLAPRRDFEPPRGPYVDEVYSYACVSEGEANVAAR